MPATRQRIRRQNTNSGWTSARGTCAAVTGLAIAVVVVCSSFFVFGDTPDDKSSKTLILSHVLFRHGDRTPTEFYPNDPHGDLRQWPDGLGALTNVGKEQAYNLGIWLRKRYHDFLPTRYDPNDVYIVSSDHDRCLMSAQLLLAGLYPPKDNQIWNNQLPWQPIPVHTTPRHLDQLIVVKKPCPNYDKELNKLKKLLNSSEEDQEWFKYISDHSGYPTTNILQAESVFNTLEVEEKIGLTLPDWTKKVYPEPFKTYATKALAFYTESFLLKKIKGGPLVKEMVTHMADKTLTLLTPDRKLFLYSAHDLTLVSLLNALGVPGLFKPEPAAALIVELHKAADGSLHNVQIFYRNDSRTDYLTKLNPKKCGDPCSLASFISITSTVVPKDWDQECNAE